MPTYLGRSEMCFLVTYFCVTHDRVLMADLSEDMADEDVNSAKFLLGNVLPREKMDKAKVWQKFG